jgi:hypothetical protein
MSEAAHDSVLAEIVMEASFSARNPLRSIAAAVFGDHQRARRATASLAPLRKPRQRAAGTIMPRCLHETAIRPWHG